MQVEALEVRLAGPRVSVAEMRASLEQLPFDLTAIVMVLQGKLRVINEYETPN